MASFPKRPELEAQIKARLDDCDAFQAPNEMRARIIATYFYELVPEEDPDIFSDVENPTGLESPQARRSQF